MKKGFTLVELLGVIIILALIMVLTFPSIINFIKKGNDDIDSMSRELIYNGAKLHVKENPEIYDNINGNVYCVTLTELMEEGNLPEDIKLKEEQISSLSVKIKYNDKYEYEIVDTNSCMPYRVGCSLESDENNNDILDTGDIVICGTEYFYVVPKHDYAADNTTSMLAKYNLNVGENPYPSDTIGIQSENAKAGKCNSKGDCTNVYGWTSFTYYDYYTRSREDSKLADVWSSDFNSNDNFVFERDAVVIKKHLIDYERYLKGEIGIRDVDVTMLTMTQAKDLGCNPERYACRYGYDTENPANSDPVYTNEAVPKWLDTSGFWIMSIDDGDWSESWWHIEKDGSFHKAPADFNPYRYSYDGRICTAAHEKYNPEPEESCYHKSFANFYGVRPVVIIPTSQIK